MIPMYHHQWLPYGRFTSTNTAHDLRIGSRLLRKLYNDLFLNCFYDVEYFLKSKILKVGKDTGNRWMYSHNTFSCGSWFSMLTNAYNNNTVAMAQTSS